MTAETTTQTRSTAVDHSTPALSSGTEPDEWRLGEYARVVVDSDGSPR